FSVPFAAVKPSRSTLRSIFRASPYFIRLSTQATATFARLRDCMAVCAAAGISGRAGSRPLIVSWQWAHNDSVSVGVITTFDPMCPWQVEQLGPIPEGL